MLGAFDCDGETLSFHILGISKKNVFLVVSNLAYFSISLFLFPTLVLVHCLLGRSWQFLGKDSGGIMTWSLRILYAIVSRRWLRLSSSESQFKLLNILDIEYSS